MKYAQLGAQWGAPATLGLTLVVPKYNKDADPFGMGFWFTGLGGFFWGFFEF